MKLVATSSTAMSLKSETSSPALILLVLKLPLLNGSIRNRRPSQLLTKLKNWKSFLPSAQDLPQTMKKKLQDRIDEADKQLNAHVQAIQKAIDNIFASAKNSKSLQDLMEAEKRLESITSFAPQESVL